MIDLQSPTEPWQPQPVHSDRSQRAVVNTQEVTWYSTPYTGIWFQSFEADPLIQEHPLTMLTYFEPGGFFDLHGHPGGEEILVLQGKFVDETGEYPAGSYLLNPEGFDHTPFSADGCVTFVKLRQHDGGDRQQIKINIHDLPWRSTATPRISVKLLYQQVGFPERVQIERWQPGTTLPQVDPLNVREIFVLKGNWVDETGEYAAGTWLRYPPGDFYRPSSPEGCLIYVKTYPLFKAELSDHPSVLLATDRRL
jgi:anti-sigma factor ChrR (cupin superfamily)